jgi:hypothetical protein
LLHSLPLHSLFNRKVNPLLALVELLDLQFKTLQEFLVFTFTGSERSATLADDISILTGNSHFLSLDCINCHYNVSRPIARPCVTLTVVPDRPIF